MRNKNIMKAVTVLVPIAAVFIYSIKDYILSLVFSLPPCTFYMAYDAYCPSCGSTRSVTALLHGDLATSLRLNIVPVILAILMSLGYIEIATYSYGKHTRLLPRRLNFYVILILFLILYWIIRNFIPYLTP